MMLYPWMLKLNNIFDKLRENKRIQIVLGLLPCLFCFIYTTAFLIDTFNTYGVLSINDNIVKYSLRKDAIMNVVKEDNIYKVFSDDTLEIDKKDGFVCNIHYELGNDVIYYIYEISNKQYLINYGCDYIEYNENNDSFIIDDNVEVIVDNNESKLCEIVFKDNDFYIKTDKQEVLLNKDNNFIVKGNKISINNNFYTTSDEVNKEKYFTTLLNDDLLHYDGVNKMYIQNISPDFLKHFLLGTNSLLFLGIFILYVMALIYWGKHNNLKYFVSKPIIISNIVSGVALILGILIAIILFI